LAVGPAGILPAVARIPRAMRGAEVDRNASASDAAMKRDSAVRRDMFIAKSVSNTPSSVRSGIREWLVFMPLLRSLK